MNTLKRLFLSIFWNKRKVSGCNIFLLFLFFYFLLHPPAFAVFWPYFSCKKGLTLICYQTQCLFETPNDLFPRVDVGLGLGGSLSGQLSWQSSLIISFFIYLWGFQWGGDLRLSSKILALLHLSVNLFQLRLNKKLKINFFCFKELNIDKPVFFVS